MQPSDLEKLVEGFLVQDHRTLIAPQYFIRVLGENRYVDVLALRPRERKFYLVEVTESKTPDVRQQKKFNDYRKAADRIAKSLAKELCLDGEWRVVPWLIIHADCRDAFKKSGFWKPDFEISYIEDLTAKKKEIALVRDEPTTAESIEASDLALSVMRSPRPKATPSVLS